MSLLEPLADVWENNKKFIVLRDFLGTENFFKKSDRSCKIAVGVDVVPLENAMRPA